MNRRLASVIVLVLGLVVYPAVLLAGGTPHFPKRTECIHAATARESENLVAAFGRFHERGAASARQRRVLSAGFKGAEIRRDGCGFIRVVVPGIPSLAVGRALVAEARTVDLHPTLESMP